MPERSILEILCNVEHWLNWTRHFGLFSKKAKYPLLLNVIFLLRLATCNLGPNQMARHSQGAVTSHMISYTNRRHISAAKMKLQFGILSILQPF